MQLVVKADNFELPERLKTYAETKVSRLSKIFNNIQKIDVEFTDEAVGKKGNSKKVEITLNADGRMMRSEVLESSFYVGVDSALEKLERQLKEFKKKLIYSKRSLDKEKMHGALQKNTVGQRLDASSSTEPLIGSAADLPEEEPFRIVKRKTFSTKPMTCEEAILQMELSGHPFFIFVNAESSQVNLVYKRNAGGYGIIVPAEE